MWLFQSKREREEKSVIKEIYGTITLFIIE